MTQMASVTELRATPAVAMYARSMASAIATISVSAESRLAAWDRPNVRRYNHEDQQIDYPGDKFFEFVPQMVDRLLVWGS